MHGVDTAVGNVPETWGSCRIHRTQTSMLRWACSTSRAQDRAVWEQEEICMGMIQPCEDIADMWGSCRLYRTRTSMLRWGCSTTCHGHKTGRCGARKRHARG